MIAPMARVSILGSLLVLIAGCFRPALDTHPITTSLGDMRATCVNYPGRSEIKTGPRRLKLDGVQVKQILLADFNGKRCLAVLSDADKPVSLYEVRADSLQRVWSGLFKSVNPWKLQIGDIDGDGSDDLMVGVYKKARFHPVMAKRPWIYGWDGRTMYAKWLGSRLSRPFTDFVLADFGSGVRIVAIEETKDGANELAVYKWDAFGVIREWNGAGSAHLSDLAVIDKSTIRVRSGSSVQEYVWRNQSLKPKEAH